VQRIAANSNDAALRSQANRELMALELQSLKAPLAAAKADPILRQPFSMTMPPGSIFHQQYMIAKAKADALQAKVDAINGIERALAVGGSNGPPHYVLSYDTGGPRGHAVISTGDPYAASTRNVTTGVFGMTSQVAGIDGDIVRDDRIFNSANAANPGQPTAVVTWYGYTAPRKLGLSGPKDVLFTAEGKQGGIALSQFQQQLVDLKQGPPAHMTVIAHSYGGEVTGFAAQQPGGLHAQDVIFIGSVGTPQEGLNALKANGVHVWTARYANDVARDTTQVSKLGGVLEGAPYIGPVLGVGDLLFHEKLTTQLADPNAEPWINHLTTGYGLPNSASGTHGHYWDDPTALNNLSSIGAGLPPPPNAGPVEPPQPYNTPYFWT
jgi:hypothetical protein